MTEEKGKARPSGPGFNRIVFWSYVYGVQNAFSYDVLS